MQNNHNYPQNITNNKNKEKNIIFLHYILNDFFLL